MEWREREVSRACVARLSQLLLTANRVQVREGVLDHASRWCPATPPQLVLPVLHPQKPQTVDLLSSPQYLYCDTCTREGKIERIQSEFFLSCILPANLLKEYLEGSAEGRHVLQNAATQLAFDCGCHRPESTLELNTSCLEMNEEVLRNMSINIFDFQKE